jgi:alginate O-acetyltransferase complex protein AlgI
MFPQLISGPIMKYSDISVQIKSRVYSFHNLEKGLKMFIIGLGLKVLIADRIGILWNDIQTIGFESISTPLAWLGAFGYSLQLYFDFYGYSLMAIGLGRILGFSLPDNFDHPYISRSVSEFWRRWHITLGRWFKNYIYIPMGGNRSGTKRLILNLFVVWAFTGLWLGASWNFILWGLTLFVLICCEKLFLKKLLERSKVLSRVYVLTVMPLTWMLFAISSLADIKIYFGRMFCLIPGISVNLNDFFKYIIIYKVYFILGIFFCMPFAWKWYSKHEKSILCYIILLVVFWYSVYQLANGINNPFLYFKF